MTIDELVVALTLDPTKFTKGQQQALDAARKAQEDLMRRAKGMEETATRMNNFFGRLRTEAVGLFTALAGARGLKDFVANLVTGDAAVGRLARSTGQSAAEIARFQGAAELVGGSAAEMAAGFVQIGDALQNIQRGTANVEFMRLLGAIQVQGGHAIVTGKGINAFLESLARNFQAIEKATPGGAGWFSRQLGLNDTMLQLLIRGDDELKKVLEEVHRIGTATKETTDKAEGLLKVWNAMSLAVKNLGRVVGVELGPTVEKIGGRYNEGLKNLAEPGDDFWKAVAIALLGPFAPLLFEKPGGAAKPAGAAAPATGAPARARPQRQSAVDSRLREIPFHIESSFGALGAGGAAVVNNAGASNSSRTEVNVNGPVTVTTQATDAEGVATEFGARLLDYARRQNLAAQSQTGAQ